MTLSGRDESGEIPAPDPRAERAWARSDRRFDEGLARGMRVTPVLLAVLAAIHVAVGLSQRAKLPLWWRLFGEHSRFVLTRWGGLAPAKVHAGEVWRVVSYGFLHLDLVHLGLNGLALVGLGRIGEVVFGRTRMLAIFLASVVGGALLSLTGPGPGPTVGASGGLFGLMGALLAFGLRRRRWMSAWLRGIFGRKLWPWVVLNLALGAVIPVVDGRAHVGGLLAGALVGLVSGDRITDNHAPRPFVTGILLVGMTVVLTWAATMVWIRP